MVWTFTALINTIDDISDTTQETANLVHAIELVKGDRCTGRNDEIAMSVLRCAAVMLERLESLARECREMAVEIEKTTGGDKA